MLKFSKKQTRIKRIKKNNTRNTRNKTNKNKTNNKTNKNKTRQHKRIRHQKGGVLLYGYRGNYGMFPRSRERNKNEIIVKKTDIPHNYYKCCTENTDENGQGLWFKLKGNPNSNNVDCREIEYDPTQIELHRLQSIRDEKPVEQQDAELASWRIQKDLKRDELTQKLSNGISVERYDLENYKLKQEISNVIKKIEEGEWILQTSSDISHQRRIRIQSILQVKHELLIQLFNQLEEKIRLQQQSLERRQQELDELEQQRSEQRQRQRELKELEVQQTQLDREEGK